MRAEILRSLSQAEVALARLRVALLEPESNPLWLDGTIQRFEFTVELLWNSMKKQLEFEGLSSSTPRETLQLAHQAGWLDDEALWLKLLRDRNLTSHTYNELVARDIYGDVRSAMPEFERVLRLLQQRAARD